ncbi:MAG: 30S ribosomal protein S15 [Tenericutes bacterium]|nr:MAG: 30S ribosomal protein S15 [Mycoplasmatota bacterium]
MALTAEQKKDLIVKFGGNEKNTGNPEAIVAILTQEIKELSDHLIINKKDFHSKRGLHQKLSQRTSTLAYIKSLSNDRYLALIKELGLRK